MSEHLSTFLIELASDPARAARFGADPAAELALTALTIEERTVVLTGDAEGIRRLLDAGPGGGRTSTHHRGNGNGRKNGGRVMSKKSRKGARKSSRKRPASKKK